MSRQQHPDSGATPIGRTCAVAVATGVLFFLSAVFPIGAAFVTDTEAWPKWWGVADVTIAFALGAFAVICLALGHSRVSREAEAASYRVYRRLIHGLLLLPVIAMLAGDRIRWGQCLTGFAWRAWLLSYCLPAWFVLFRPPPENQ